MELKAFLQSKFDKSHFIEFISERFYGFSQNLIDDGYLGKVKLDDKSEIGFFVFKEDERKDIENTRVGFHGELKAYAQQYDLDGAWGAFYNLTCKAWRLSFIRFSYDDKNKKICTHQKRFTFVLGIEAINTPLGAFTKTHRYKNIDEIQNDFSVEAVTKEFFEEYRKLFESLNAQLQFQKALFINDETMHAFSKKLLGRLVFIYFLQKKGWLGVPQNEPWGRGDKHFLSHLFEKRSDDFYGKVLTPLFFDTLNSKREDDYSSLFTCKIPFLNGGLFDQKEYDDKVFLDDALFGEIFDVFNRYNFTIIEDSPDESEIAIDPEMLGRVFENLLEENYRKGKGAFYTPREIVSYMCKSSVERYLEHATKEHQSHFGVDEFLKLAAMDDEAIGDFYRKHPQKYVVIPDYFKAIKAYKNLVVNFRVVAKLRGYIKQNDELIKNASYGGHREIGVDIWQKVLKKEYVYHSHIIGSNKEIRVDERVSIYPTLIKYIQIEDSFFALAFLPNLFGDLELNTIFPIRKRSLKSKTNQQDKIFESWNHEDFVFSSKVLEALKSLWRDCHSPHTVLEYQNTQEHNTASRFSEISHKLFNVENLANKDLKRYLGSKWYNLQVNQILNNSSIPQKDLREVMLEKIKGIKVLDPAIGSGAFPMGMLHEIVQTRLHLGDKTPYAKLKREIIEDSIYGVDIDSDAVEIAKLRFWLSLTVDEDIPSPLPNLDFKIMQGNSLIETINGFALIPPDIYDKTLTKQINLFGTLAQQTLFDDKIFDKITAKIHEFYSDTSGSKKQSDKQAIKNLIKELIGNYLDAQKQEYENREKDIQHSNATNKKKIADKMSDLLCTMKMAETTLAELLKNNFQTKELFLYKLFFGEVLREGGFDVVIGNPPYVGEKGNKETFAPLKKLKYYQGKMDLFYFFFHVGLDNLKNGGILSLITTNYYITATGAVKLRNDFKERSTVLNLINFNELKIFESALGQHNLITILQKGKFDKLANTSMVNVKGYLGTEILQSIVEGKNKDTKYYQVPQDKLFSGGNMQLTIGGIDDILDKMLIISKPLDDITNVRQGLRTGADYVTKKHLVDYGFNGNIGDGIFVIPKNYNIDIEKSILKDWYKNSDINKYITNFTTNEYVIFSEKNNTEIEFKNIFPKAYKHLMPFKILLEKIRERNKEKIDYWFTLDRTRDSEMFEVEKIIAPQRSYGNTFAYSNNSFYASADVYFITKPKDGYLLKFILAILNSKLIYKWLYYRGKRKGEMLELYQEPLSKIPIIKDICADVQNLFVLIVDYIIFLKQQEFSQNNDLRFAHDRFKEASFFERLIDCMVYELYFAEELHKDHVYFIEPLQNENLPLLQTMNDKPEGITAIFEKLNNPNHAIKKNMDAIESIEVIQTIEGKEHGGN